MNLQLSTIVIFVTTACARVPPPCNNDIYCYGPLLRTVQMSGIFEDSKTFINMKIKRSHQTTLANFDQLMKTTNDLPSKEELKQFVFHNFEDGNELEHWEPTDYKSNPTFLRTITNPPIQDFAQKIVNLWPILSRKVKEDVLENPSNYSFIPVPNVFVIPGGKSQEYYYWDTYWIIQGLLISEMGDTVRGIVENYFHLVKTLGFVPNGGRIYLTDRSQPPLLSKMANAYYTYSNNKEWLKQNIHHLAHELDFWKAKNMITVEKEGKKYSMYHYSAASTDPRPESYTEDLKAAMLLANEDEREQFYIDIKSASESAWDSSSRWLFDNTSENVASASYIATRRVVPVDLNAFLCEAFSIVSTLYSELGQQREANSWLKLKQNLQKAIQNVLWDEEDGTWYDFDTKFQKPRKYFYPSNLTPLWCKCIDHRRSKTYGKRIVHYLEKQGVLNTPGGIPTSILNTGEQWDFPNAWPPLQGIVVQALENSEDSNALWLARTIAVKWVDSNLKGFLASGEMFEKYNALQSGQYGGGAEYTVQPGFGWTNGVILEFIKRYYGNEDYVTDDDTKEDEY